MTDPIDLDDDALHEHDGSGWLDDTGNLLWLLAAALVVEHSPLWGSGVGTVEQAIRYAEEKGYDA